MIEFITGVGAPPLQSALTTANGQPAIGWYILDREQESFLPASLEVLTLDGKRVKEIVAFVSPGLFERFGLPVAVPEARQRRKGSFRAGSRCVPLWIPRTS